MTAPALCDMIDKLIEDKSVLADMNRRITELKDKGIYNGGYEVVKLAEKGKRV